MVYYLVYNQDLLWISGYFLLPAYSLFQRRVLLENWCAKLLKVIVLNGLFCIENVDHCWFQLWKILRVFQQVLVLLQNLQVVDYYSVNYNNETGSTMRLILQPCAFLDLLIFRHLVPASQRQSEPLFQLQNIPGKTALYFHFFDFKSDSHIFKVNIQRHQILIQFVGRQVLGCLWLHTVSASHFDCYSYEFFIKKIKAKESIQMAKRLSLSHHSYFLTYKQKLKSLQNIKS